MREKIATINLLYRVTGGKEKQGKAKKVGDSRQRMPKMGKLALPDRFRRWEKVS
jgi:hypothetical protein